MGHYLLTKVAGFFASKVAKRLLGRRPQCTFQEGVAQLVHWYQANRIWAKDMVT